MSKTAIGKMEYARGVFCHAVSKVAVRLPAPGQAFSSFVGVDSNSQTRGGRGSIVFRVTVAGKEAFRSKIMRERMPAERVNIDLGGATEFLLEVGDAGDGITCDQADWGDAKITLADGRILWLGDLPIIEGQEAPAISTDPPFSFSYDGQSSAALLEKWKLDRHVKKLDAQRTERTITWTDPKTKGIKDADYELMRQLCQQFRRVADCYLGDYYPLTPYSLENTSWMGWQFDRPDRGTGLVQVFRRSESVYKSADLRLHGLGPEARYRVQNLDSPEADVITGRQLMEIGLPVVLNDRPSAIVIRYEKVGP